MAIHSNLAGVARVAFEAQTGEFNRDIATAEARYRSATAGMSDGAIRLELAQERLRRALAKGPAAYRAIASAQLAVRREEAALEGQTNRTSSALAREERSLGRLTRGAVAGSGVFRGLGRSVAFASTSFLGGAGLVYAIRATFEEAVKAESQIRQTATAVERAGLSWERYGDSIKQAAKQQSELTGFDDERLLVTFSAFVRRTKDVNEALRLNGLAADIARGAHIDLEQAMKIVLRASVGQARGLANIGVAAQKGATGVELLRLLTVKFAGSAAKATNTAEVAQDRFSVAIENTQQAIAAGYLPALTRALNLGADWLNDSKNQERIQRDVNTAVREGGQAIRGLAAGIKAVNSVVRPLVDGLGGVENATKIAFGLWVVNRLRLIAGGLALIRTRALGAAGAYGTLAAAETAAGAAGGAGGVGVLGRVAGLGGPLTLAGTAIVGSYLFNKGKRDENEAKWDAMTGREQQAALVAGGKDFETAVHLAGWKLKPVVGVRHKTGSRYDTGTPGSIPGAAEAGPRRRPPPTADLPRNLTDAALRASLTQPLADDLRAAKAEEAFLRRQLDRAKKGTKLYSDILSALSSAHSQTESIASQIAADQKRHGDKLAATRKKAAADAKKQAADLAKAALGIGAALSGGVFDAFGKPNKGKVSDLFKATAGSKKTERDFNAESFDFLQSLHGIQNEFGSNVKPTVIVNQHFPEMTPDRHREAIYARHALETAFQTS